MKTKRGLISVLLGITALVVSLGIFLVAKVIPEFGNKKDTRYLSVVYQNASKQYRTLEEVLGPKPEFLPTLLGTETNKAQYERLITPLKQQLLSFINWYSADAETINDSFSYEAIEKVIDSEVEYRYGKERKEAEDEYRSICEDEKVWHALARAYGSRSDCGTKPDSMLTEDDWNYISGSLEEFKKHFDRTDVNLKQMYDEYETKIKPEWLRCYKLRDEVLNKCRQYRIDLYTLYEKDVFQKINQRLKPLVEALSLCIGGSVDVKDNEPGNNEKSEKIGKRTGTFENLRQCIPSQEVYEAVIRIANNRTASHQRINGPFGYELFTQLMGYGFIHEKKCTVSHFGNLLLKEFGGKCSFRDGGALYDGKDTVDFELRKEIQSEFDMIKLARQ